VGFELADAAGNVGADERGVPTKISNLADLRREERMPLPLTWVGCPAGFSHGPPPNPSYQTEETEK
jgi:hypothetical protein